MQEEDFSNRSRRKAFNGADCNSLEDTGENERSEVG